MKKTHELNIARIDGMSINYFFKREKSDPNGNPRYKLYIMDPDAPAAYEIIIKCYESQIKEHVINFIEAALC